MKSVLALCEKLKSVAGAPQPNVFGNMVYRHNWSDSRYTVDFAEDFKVEGWMQFDTGQDAEYFGVWVNPVKRLTLTYCEGDWTLVECPTWETYVAEIQDAIAHYSEGFIAKCVDIHHGRYASVTTLVQDRSVFLRKPDDNPQVAHSDGHVTV